MTFGGRSVTGWIDASGPAHDGYVERTPSRGETNLTVGSSTGAVRAAVAVVYRGVDPFRPVGAVAAGGTPTTTSLVTPSMSPTTASEQLVVFRGAAGIGFQCCWS